MDTNELRIATLRRIMGRMGNKEFGEQFGIEPSYISQLLNGHRSFGEKAARNMEIKIGVPPGTLTSPVNENGAAIESAPEDVSFEMAAELFSQATPRTQKVLNEIMDSANKGELTEADALLLHQMYKRIVKK
ncbi:hypothetical protein ACS8E9_09450 [Pseudomonas neustonica]|uniref:hypothetical protein n=1 Tax=Pseudomonas neustonica TaxID=2487346 RepID=UPI003F46FE64